MNPWASSCTAALLQRLPGFHGEGERNTNLEAEVIQEEGQAAEGYLGGVDGHAASSAPLGGHQVGIVWQPDGGYQGAVGVHHHLPWNVVTCLCLAHAPSISDVVTYAAFASSGSGPLM